MSTQPFLPFARPTIDEATIAAVGEVLRSGWITSGPKVQALEAALGEYFGRPVRCYNSGTCTLQIALKLCGVQAGDEVITTPLTWVSTCNVILELGAKPVFVDIDPRTRNIDASQIAAAITPRTKAIMPVHLTGLPADLDTIYAVAQQHGLRVVEDAAQAIDAEYLGQTFRGKVGSFGDYASFSFHANKNLTTTEGGCLVFPKNVDEATLKLAERLRLQGVSRTGADGMDVDVIGGKYNLTDMAAVIGLHQLPQLAGFTARRRALAQQYFARLGNSPLVLAGVELPVEDYAQSNWHMFQLVLPAHISRAKVIERLKTEFNIGIGVHYPAVHLFTLYRQLGFHEGQYPHAEKVGRSTITLPLFPTMADADVNRVITALETVLETL